MKLETKNDLIFAVNALIENKNIENKKELFLAVREKVLDLYISQGNILPENYSKLYFILKGLNIDPHPQYIKHIKFFKDYYSNASVEEKYILNNFLFRLEVLNGNINAIKDYIKRAFLFNLHRLTADKDGMEFRKLLNNNIDENIGIEVFKEMIEPKYFFSLNSEERRSIFVNSLAILWNNPTMYSNKIWLNVFDDLVDLLNKTIEKNLIEEQMYIHFFTYHIYTNNIHTTDEYKIFSEKVEKPAGQFYKKFGEEHNIIKAKETISKDKKRIGFLVDRMVLNSPFLVLYSLIKALAESDEFKKDYEIYIYSMNYVDKQDDFKELIDAILKLGVNFFSPYENFSTDGFYYSHLKKATILREKIIEDKIDYLIGGGGYDIPIFLFATRTAPKQLFWSHGSCVNDFEGIDERISHFEQECKQGSWKIFNVPIAEEFLIGSENDKEQGEAIKKQFLQEFGEETVIFGTIGRLIKVDSEEYLKTVAEIMKENPNTIYLACGDGNIESIKQKISKYGIDEKRFIFTGHINPHVYGWVIDIWLNTFPLVGGQAVDEFRAKENGIIIHFPADLNGKILSEKEAIENLYIVDKKKKELLLELFEIDEDELMNNIESLNVFRIKIFSKLIGKDASYMLDILEDIQSENIFYRNFLKQISYFCKDKDFFNANKKFNIKRKRIEDRIFPKSAEGFLDAITEKS